MHNVYEKNTELASALVKSIKAYKRLARDIGTDHATSINVEARYNKLISSLKTQFEDEFIDEFAEYSANEVISEKSEITVRKRSDLVRIGIASMPGRESGLRIVLQQLAPQADEIYVYLNSMSSVSSLLPEYKNVRYFTGPDLGDRGKFQFMENFSGYYLTCDDDIVYPNNYVQTIIKGIEKYSRKAIVGWHGSIFKEDFQKFYDAKYRQVLSFSKLRGKDTFVHILGTGVCGFHTSTLSLSTEDFKLPNMADVYLGIQCQQQRVPMIVLRHEGDRAIPIDTAAAISSVSMGKAKQENLDVGQIVTKLVQNHMPWTINEIESSASDRLLKVAFIGRTDKVRWKKGGILKSAHLTKDMLEAEGHEVRLYDIETSNITDVSHFKPDCVIIYVGDPERPDFATVENLIDRFAAAHVPVLINLSVNMMEKRSGLVVSRMRHYESRYGALVSLMVFTAQAKQIPAFTSIRHLMTVFPKSLETYREIPRGFGERRGVFIGDIGKLSNPELIDGDVHEWIRAIRQAVPDEPIIAVQQYRPANHVSLDVDEVWPFMHDDYEERLSSVKLMVNPIKYATFEMVPAEAASLGVPVIHSAMPQSLSETFGGASIEVSNPKELAEYLPMICNENDVWNGLSSASCEAVAVKRMSRMAPIMNVYLRAFVNRAKRGN